MAELIPTKLTAEQRVDLGKRMAFLLADAAHNMPDENTVKLSNAD